jgi:hypothetical protein
MEISKAFYWQKIGLCSGHRFPLVMALIHEPKFGKMFAGVWITVDTYSTSTDCAAYIEIQNVNTFLMAGIFIL